MERAAARVGADEISRSDPAVVRGPAPQGGSRGWDVPAVLRLQRTAGNAAVGRVLARHPAEKVLKFAVKWMSKRTFKQVSKHIAKHGRNIAGKALHSIFKRPNDISWLIKRTLSEAEALAARQGKKAADEILEEGGADRIAMIGLGVAGALALEEGTAEAAEQIRADAEDQARKAAEKEDSWGDWQEWIPFIGDVWGGSLNEGEDEYLRQQRFYADVVDDIIKRVEYEENRTISGPEREELRDLIRAGVAAPYMVDEADAEVAR